MHRIVKSAVAVASGVAVAVGVTVAGGTSAGAATACATTFTQYRTIRTGSSGAQARAAQCLLKSEGYSVMADGGFSSADAAQLKRFQSRHKLRSSGEVDARSWVALLSGGSRPALRFGDRGGAVARLQRSLTATGRYVPATGYFGPITRNAVTSLQRAKYTETTGTVNASMWSTLHNGGGVQRTAAVSAGKAASKPKKRAKQSSTSNGARVVAFAKRQLGDRYVWGASGPNAWDCSGLTGGAWKSVGVTLPHNAKAQFGKGKKISRANLRPGDLVFFYRGISHVAVYAGNGKVIQASRPGRPVNVGRLKDMPYQGARRFG